MRVPSGVLIGQFRINVKVSTLEPFIDKLRPLFSNQRRTFASHCTGGATAALSSLCE